MAALTVGLCVGVGAGFGFGGSGIGTGADADAGSGSGGPVAGECHGSDIGNCLKK